MELQGNHNLQDAPRQRGKNRRFHLIVQCGSVLGLRFQSSHFLPQISGTLTLKFDTRFT